MKVSYLVLYKNKNKKGKYMFVYLFVIKVLMLQLTAEANSENSAGHFRRVTCVVEGVGLHEAK